MNARDAALEWLLRRETAALRTAHPNHVGDIAEGERHIAAVRAKIEAAAARAERDAVDACR